MATTRHSLAFVKQRLLFKLPNHIRNFVTHVAVTYQDLHLSYAISLKMTGGAYIRFEIDMLRLSDDPERFEPDENVRVFLDMLARVNWDEAKEDYEFYP